MPDVETVERVGKVVMLRDADARNGWTFSHLAVEHEKGEACSGRMPADGILKDMPFEASDDKFYSESNIRYLNEVMRDVKEGKAHFKEHELIEVD